MNSVIGDIWGIWGVGSVVFILLFTGVILGLTYAIERIVGVVKERRRRQRQMKQELLMKRDAMLADLMQRTLRRKAELNQEALEARRNLIRLSFEIHRQNAMPPAAQD